MLPLSARYLAAVITAAVLAVLPTPASADEPDPTRVLIVGDSITQGKAGDVTWRYHLWDAFREDIDLVGPKQGQAAEGGGPDVMAYPNEFDYDHAARWGMSFTYMDWTVTDLVETYDPDVVVEQLGANDLMYGIKTPQTLADGLRDFVAEARAVKPNVDIVLSQLSWTWWGPAQEFNALVSALATELDSTAARVVTSVMPAMTVEADTYDGAHPNAQGEVKIAGAHITALTSLGYIGSVPAGQPTPEELAAPVLEAPSAPAWVKAHRRGQRVKVRWAGVSGATSYVARCGKVKRPTTGLNVRVKSPSDRCRVRSVNAAGVSPWVVAK